MVLLFLSFSLFSFSFCLRFCLRFGMATCLSYSSLLTSAPLMEFQIGGKKKLRNRLKNGDSRVCQSVCACVCELKKRRKESNPGMSQNMFGTELEGGERPERISLTYGTNMNLIMWAPFFIQCIAHFSTPIKQKN